MKLNIPEILKKEKRFVCHDEFKRPINPLTGKYAKVTDSNTWASYEEAKSGVSKFGVVGIGFVLGEGYVGVDIDTCIDSKNGQVSEEAKEIIATLNSYTEISMSGMGLHTIIKAEDVKLPFNKRKMKPNGIMRPDIDATTGKQKLDKEGNPKYKHPEIEIYNKSRYFVLTGNVYGDYNQVNERSEALKKIINKYNISAPRDVDICTPTVIPMETSIKQALNLDSVFNAYWYGTRPNKDESADDLALMGKLLYWCNADVDLAIKYFMASPYTKQKDKSHLKKLDRKDYLLRTAKAAMPITTAAIDHQKWMKKKDYGIVQNSKATVNIQERLIELQPHIKYSYDDRGNGDLFADIYKDVARFNTTVNDWYIYNGKLWQRDTGAMMVSRLAKQLKDELLVFSISIENESQKTAYQKHIMKLGSRTARDTMLKDARDKYNISNEDLDKNTDLLNCQNGTLNLKTLEFREHHSKDLLSRITNVEYQPTAKSELWDRFINEVMLGDKAKIEYLKKAIGYSLTADTSLETCFILYGSQTRNGKSTLVETIMHLLGGSGGYALQMKPESLAQKHNVDSRQASGDIARLSGARFLNVSEPPKKMIFDAALLKTLLGRDSIVARHLHEREFEFIPVFKLFMNTNYLPIIQDDTLFSSGRINVITFDRHFSEKEQDKTLKNRLRENENLSGILNWCLEGLKAFYIDGLAPTNAIIDATAEYRSESDKLGKFVTECLEEANENITASSAYNVYEHWCRACGYGCENRGNFYAELRSKNLMSKTGTVDGKTKQRVIKGYKFTDEWQPLFRD
ncbi:putative DNA primase/helicase [Natranaerovirga pectinivora]|uniref:Putative DNA primase/helicase n=1 Tax=Natranaerovirga pectinivora TaxID=682400 RepID=A0A4R3MK14_9FIRM|nr:phage/plasmid primase, P4 family [Natranaerovirga pectinivora]TCT14541.1 putative DNA primase/helicase [Natranaerovirga pectinivora]